MLYSLENLENGVARLVSDDGRLLTLPAADLPPGARPGAVLRQTPDGGFEPMPAEDARRRERAAALWETLRRPR